MTDPSLPGSISLRPMRADDLDQVQVIDHESFTMPWSITAYRYELEHNPLSLLTVAEYHPATGQAAEGQSAEGQTAPAGLQVVGMVVVWLILEEAHIATIAVHPDFRGRGIGQQLMVAALKGAIERGSSEATLEVREGNIPAQKLYRRFKFEVVGDRPRYYRDNGENALIMTVKNLGENYLEWLESGAWDNSLSKDGP